MVTSGPIMYLIMGDQFLSRCHAAQSLCLRVRGCRAADRRAWQALRNLRLSAQGRTQIVPLGVTSGSHMKDQVADHIGGIVRLSGPGPGDMLWRCLMASACAWRAVAPGPDAVSRRARRKSCCCGVRGLLHWRSRLRVRESLSGVAAAVPVMADPVPGLPAPDEPALKAGSPVTNDPGCGGRAVASWLLTAAGSRLAGGPACSGQWAPARVAAGPPVLQPVARPARPAIWRC
jgi:hypothetical protein